MNPIRWGLVGAALVLGACGERPPMQSTQQGYRGTGMVDIQNPRLVAARAAAQPAVPESQPPIGNDGPKAGAVYQNVKVLGHLSVGEFTRHMVAMTQWVAPAEGCNYCHVPTNLADDSKYTKVVARSMIQMTQHLNADWTQHVGGTGVTCYTCHRGNAVPAQIAYAPPTNPGSRASVALGNDAGQNKAVPSVGLTSLPYDPFTPYLQEAEGVRVVSTTALPTQNRASIKQAEHTYSLMMHMSQALGVNCTHCHNTRSFQSWEGPTQRVAAYYGIRMARDLNLAYLAPLKPVLPAERLGPQGDVPKVSCATCHQGAPKPLNGLAMAKDFSGLLGPAAAASAPDAAASAAAMSASAVLATGNASSLPAPVNQAGQAVMYFGVGSPVLEAEQAKGLAQAIATLASNPARSASISGYHAAAGTPAQNEELAKQRALAVRSALVASGVAEGRITLEKPAQVQASTSGEDPTARRVEVNVK